MGARLRLSHTHVTHRSHTRHTQTSHSRHTHVTHTSHARRKRTSHVRHTRHTHVTHTSHTSHVACIHQTRHTRHIHVTLTYVTHAQTHINVTQLSHIQTGLPILPPGGQYHPAGALFLFTLNSKKTSPGRNPYNESDLNIYFISVLLASDRQWEHHNKIPQQVFK